MTALHKQPVLSRREQKAKQTALTEALKESYAATTAAAAAEDPKVAAEHHQKAANLARRALIHEPSSREAHYQMGLSLFHLNKFEEAGHHMKIAAEKYPDDAQIQMQFGIVLQAGGRNGAALVQFDKVAAMTSDIGKAAELRASAALQTTLPVLDWLHWDRHQRLLREAILGHGAWCIGEGVLSSPYMDSVMQLMGACNYKHKPIDTLKGANAQYRYAPLAGKIRIGFFGKHFNNSSTSWLMTAMVEKLKDVEHVETFAYDFGVHIPSLDMENMDRARIEAAYDHFHSIKDMNDQEAADFIHSHGINILLVVDSPASTRIGVLARRPAALNVSYLYYPGTTGYDFIDALVADETVVPKMFDNVYSERIVRLKGCYQPNDPSRPKPDMEKVAEYRQKFIIDKDYPENAVLLGNFNQTYKYTPDIVDLWSVLLRDETQYRVLVLLVEKEHERGRLLKEFIIRGIDPERIHFVSKVPYADHISRLRAIDLIVDTHPYGGHTLTSDALWAGTPVVTLVGSTFASRVAPSLLNAVGLGECVAISPNDYITVASAILYRDQQGQQATLLKLREMLDKAREEGCPLYDPETYAKGLVTEMEVLLAAVYNTESGIHYESHKQDLTDTYMANLHGGTAPAINLDSSESVSIDLGEGDLDTKIFELDGAVRQLKSGRAMFSIQVSSFAKLPESILAQLEGDPDLDAVRSTEGDNLLLMRSDALADDLRRQQFEENGGALSDELDIALEQDEEQKGHPPVPEGAIVHSGFRDDLMADDEGLPERKVESELKPVAVALGDIDPRAVQFSFTGELKGQEIEVARMGLANAFWQLEHGEVESVKVTGISLVPAELLDKAEHHPFFTVAKGEDTISLTRAPKDPTHKVVIGGSGLDVMENIADALDGLANGSLHKVTVVDASLTSPGIKHDLSSNGSIVVHHKGDTLVITKRAARGETHQLAQIDDGPFLNHKEEVAKIAQEYLAKHGEAIPDFVMRVLVGSSNQVSFPVAGVPDGFIESIEAIEALSVVKNFDGHQEVINVTLKVPQEQVKIQNSSLSGAHPEPKAELAGGGTEL